MTEYVLDASALIALVHKETGWQKVAPLVQHSIISAVNFGETVQRLRRGGMPLEVIQPMLRQLVTIPVPFDETQAYIAASIHEQTRSAGISFGDCACLALAMSRKGTAITAERSWERLKLDIDIQRIR